MDQAARLPPAAGGGTGAAGAVAEHWLAGGERDRARPSLLAAAERFCQVHAYHDAAHAIRRAIEQWREGEDEDDRLAALERLGGYAQLHGDLAGALRAWHEVLEVRQRRGDLKALAPLRAPGSSCRAPGIAAARTAAADAFAALGMDFESATERLVAASHLQSAAKLTAALDLIASAATVVERTRSTELRARTLSLEGQIRTKLGDTERGVELAREVSHSRSLRTSLNQRARPTRVLRRRSSTPPAIEKRSMPTQPRRASVMSRVYRVWRRSASRAWRRRWSRPANGIGLSRSAERSSIAATPRQPLGRSPPPSWEWCMSCVARPDGHGGSDGLGFARRNEVRAGDRGPQGLARADALEGRVEDAVVSCSTSSIGSQVGGASLLRLSAALDHDVLRQQGLAADRARAAEP